MEQTSVRLVQQNTLIYRKNIFCVRMKIINVVDSYIADYITIFVRMREINHSGLLRMLTLKRDIYNTQRHFFYFIIKLLKGIIFNYHPTSICSSDNWPFFCGCNNSKFRYASASHCVTGNLYLIFNKHLILDKKRSLISNI